MIFFAYIEAKPTWVRDDLLAQGARACALGGIAAMRVLLITGLMAGYQLSAVNQTLLATGALEKGASRRVAETTKWWIDVIQEGAMDRFGQGFKSTIHVRLIHAMVRRHLRTRPTWSIQALGLPVNQTDMQATYLGFSTVYLMGMRVVGIPLSTAERQAVMHLWRYIAWLMGVDESLLHDEIDAERAGIECLYRNVLTQAMADEDSKRLGRALANEALDRPYRTWRWLRSHYNHSLQLSIARACLDNHALRALGLPTFYLPWYPLITMPINQVVHRMLRLLPRGHDWLIERGRAKQLKSLEDLFGQTEKKVRDLY